jgi:hypothetical protein
MSHRQYRACKDANYRYKVLAPTTLLYAEKAVEERWSIERAAEWMDASVHEAAECLGRYRMSREIEQGKDIAQRLERAFAQWLTRFEDLSKTQRESLAKELNLHVANQLDWAAEQGKSLQEVAEALEPVFDLHAEDEAKPAESSPKLDLNSLFKPRGDQDKPPTWGPSWKE